MNPSLRRPETRPFRENVSDGTDRLHRLTPGRSGGRAGTVETLAGNDQEDLPIKRFREPVLPIDPCNHTERFPGAARRRFICTHAAGHCHHLLCVSFGRDVTSPNYVRFLRKNEKCAYFSVMAEQRGSGSGPVIPVGVLGRRSSGDLPDKLPDRVRVPGAADCSAAAHSGRPPER